MAIQSAQQRSAEAREWKKYLKRDYGLKVAVSRKRFERFQRDTYHDAEASIPKTVRDHVAHYVGLLGVLSFVASLFVPLLGLIGRASIWHFLYLFVAAFLLVFWSGKLDEKRNKAVQIRSRALLTIRLDEFEEQQLEYESFYRLDEWRRLRKIVFARDGRTCGICRKRIRRGRDLTIDHIKPRSLFPALALDRSNLRVLCRSCNSAKGASTRFEVSECHPAVA